MKKTKFILIINLLSHELLCLTLNILSTYEKHLIFKLFLLHLLHRMVSSTTSICCSIIRMDDLIVSMQLVNVVLVNVGCEVNFFLTIRELLFFLEVCFFYLLFEILLMPQMLD